MISSIILLLKDILKTLFIDDGYYSDEIIYDYNDEIKYVRSGDLNE